MKIKDKIHGDEFQKYIRIHGAVMIIQELCDRITYPDDDDSESSPGELVALLTIGENLLSPDDRLMEWTYVRGGVYDRIYRMLVPCSVSDPNTYYLNFDYASISKDDRGWLGDMTLLCNDEPMISSRECVTMPDDDLSSKTQASPAGLIMRSILKAMLERLYDGLYNVIKISNEEIMGYMNFADMVTFVPWYDWDWQWRFTHDSDRYEISHESMVDKATYRVVFTGRMLAHSLMGELSLYKGEQQILSVIR